MLRLFHSDRRVRSERYHLEVTTGANHGWKKGDRNGRTHLERKFSRWSLHTRLKQAEGLEAHVDDVLEQLEPVRERIVDLVKEVAGEMVLVGHFHRNYPGLHFEAVTLSRLAAINVSMDMDFYYLYSDKREDS